MALPEVVTREEWLTARGEHRARTAPTPRSPT